VYVDGKKTVTLKGDNIGIDFIDIINSYVEKNYQADKKDQK
jgi:hypothetical protein